MKNLKRLTFLLFSMSILFASCTKENVRSNDENPMTEHEFQFIESSLSDYYSSDHSPISIDFKNDQLYIGDEDMTIHIYDEDYTYEGKVETQGGAHIYAYTLRHKYHDGFFIYNQEYKYLMAYDKDNHRYAELNELPALDNEYISAIDSDVNDNLFMIYDHNTIHKYSSDLNEPLAVHTDIKNLFNHGKYNYEIMSISVDNDQNIYISIDVHDQEGEGYDVVLQFDNNLSFLRIIKGERAFDGPCGIAFDNANNMYVVNRWSSVVKVFNNEFEQIAISGPEYSPSNGRGMLDEPIGIRINNNKVYITEKKNHRISVFTAYN